MVKMMRARDERGVTLIECLLALIVVAIGMVGVLSMFPVALNTSKESMEISQAAKLAESVKHALHTALKNAEYDATNKRWLVTFTHDLSDGTSANRLDLALPRTDEGWKRFPGDTSISEGTTQFQQPQLDPAYGLGADAWVREHVNWVHDQSDPSDPYSQFAFTIDVRKINTLSYVNPVPPDLEKQTGLYEFRIHVFRARNASPVVGETTTVTTGGDNKDLITSLRCNISVH